MSTNVNEPRGDYLWSRAFAGVIRATWLTGDQINRLPNYVQDALWSTARRLQDVTEERDSIRLELADLKREIGR